MPKLMKLVLCVASVALCCGQPLQNPVENNTGLHNGLSEKIGNFSIEILFHTSKTLQEGDNFIMSPITVWSVLAVIAEGAAGDTRNEINNVLRLSARNKESTRTGFRNITQWLQVNTGTVKLAKINAIFVDKDRLPLPEFTEISKNYYQTEMVTLDFKDSARSANILNQAISNITHGKIPNMVDASYFQDSQMVLTSALYFKGQWAMPFNASSTEKMPFYDSKGQKIGEVNMMYNRHTYPFSNIKQLQARVIELPYGNENRLSMLIMLPNPGVSLEDMFSNFKNVNLDTFFEELRVSKEEYSDDEVDCYIPRFKIQSDIDLTNVLKNRLGIQELFDQSRAKLPFMARTPLYVSKVIHKAEIEVTEEGTEAAGVTVAEFSNRIGVVQFQANRPFTYMIIEKVTNSIVFGGFYKTPSLY
ncbi:serine protease inhibitor 77Ba-like [Spodoptera litura]|uniref:Serine protease inhibitor 77Ba-like n=1 Tax=Spodoptera litura TaxID=69820 RepID=A0A9J7EWE5_SPOLT|nr:serine protease inhibitor 77Ba-like [Spodoptera litura]